MMSARAWQVEALRAWESALRGVVAAVTGGGKTLFALYAYDSLRQSIPDLRLLVVVPSLALLDQWVVTLICDLGLRADEIATFSGERRASEPRLANVVVLNTARDLVAELTRDGKWMLVVDECHRAGSPQNARALNGNFFAVLGISATPERQFDEGFRTYIEPVLGPVIFTYDYVDARRDGVIANFELLNVQFALTTAEQNEYARLTRALARLARRAGTNDASERDARFESLARQRARVSLGARWRVPSAVAMIRQLKGKAIVFHERISVAEDLAGILNNGDRRATTYHSKIYPTTRQERLRQFRQGVFDTLVTCRALDEGLNVPDASLAVLVASTTSRRQRIQRLGRVLRATGDNKTATIVTLYATEAEKRQLEAEASIIEGVASVRWFEAKR